MTSQQLADRMVRDRKAYLTSLGFESEEELAAMQSAQRERVAADETARREQQTREETLQEDLNTANTERDVALEQAETLRWERHVSGICARMGVRNVEYATFELERAADATPEGQEFDVEAWIAERIDPENVEQHGTMAAALGMEAPSVETRNAPVTNSGAGEGNAPAPPPAGGGEPAGDDAFALDPQAWAARREALGIA